MNTEELDKAWAEREKWFTDRIGKRIYRNENSCTCEVCKGVGNHGLVIFDRTHAQYLQGAECELGVYYFDTPEEVEEYMKSNS